MKVLIHGPFHPSLWVYLISSLPEYEWYVERDEWEGCIPRDHIKYKIFNPKRDKPDAQIICLHNPDSSETLTKFPYPPVFLEYCRFKNLPDLMGYPLIYTSKSNHNEEYSNIRFWYATPSKSLWNEKWVGDKKVITVLHRSGNASILKKIQRMGLPVECLDITKRNIPFEEWKSILVHSRVIIEMIPKSSSSILLECQSIGTPTLAYGFDDSKLMTHTFTSASYGLRKVLRRLLDDDDYARTWWDKYPSHEDTAKEVFGSAFKESIALYNTLNEKESHHLIKDIIRKIHTLGTYFIHRLSF